MWMKAKAWLNQLHRGNISYSGHVRIKCDTCGYDFGYDTVDGAEEALESNLRCPNCKSGIDYLVIK